MSLCRLTLRLLLHTFGSISDDRFERLMIVKDKNETLGGAQGYDDGNRYACTFPKTPFSRF